jgi:hypothetical protein
LNQRRWDDLGRFVADEVVQIERGTRRNLLW